MPTCGSRVSQPGVTETKMWGAYEKVSMKRRTAERASDDATASSFSDRHAVLGRFGCGKYSRPTLSRRAEHRHGWATSAGLRIEENLSRRRGLVKQVIYHGGCILLLQHPLQELLHALQGAGFQRRSGRA
jgi:hypothetical protein